MNRLLIIDDNEEIQSANRDYLTRRGYMVDMAMDGATALRLLKNNHYDCVVLDVMLPGLDGFAVCRMARREVETPIIFLSCMDGEDDRVRGLMAGGDDYMTKPYSLKELAARIHAQIRRDKVLYTGNGSIESPAPSVLYDRESHIIAIGGVNLVMSRKECEILNRLTAAQDRLVEKETLLAIVDGEESTLGVYIKRIRKKLEAHGGLGKIEMVYGQGYRYIVESGAEE